MLLDKDMGIFTPAVIRMIKDYLAFPVYDCCHDRCMEKIPFIQVLDYSDAFHDDFFKKQFELSKNTRINPLSYFSGLPSGDLVSDGEFDTYLCEQMFQEEFEFTVADDTSVAAFTNFRNSLGQKDVLGLVNFSKDKCSENHLQSKLKKLNTFNLGDNKINSIANAGDIEIIDALFGNSLESGLVSSASMERLPDRVESMYNSLRAIQGKSLPASPGKECQSPKIISPDRKISSPDDNTDESGFPYQEIKLQQKSSVIKLLENPCNLVIEEMPEGESINYSSQYHISKSKSNSVNKENLSSESKKEDSNILSSLDQNSITIPELKDPKLEEEYHDSEPEIKDKEISEDYEYDSMYLARKLENKESQPKKDKIHYDDVVRNLLVTLNDNELSRKPVKNIETFSEAGDVCGVVGVYVKDHAFRPSNIDYVYEPTSATHNRLIRTEVQSPLVNVLTSEIFKSETGQSTANYHQRLSQNSLTAHKTKILDLDDLDRKIKTARLKNIALDAEINTVNDDLEARIRNSYNVKVIGSQKIEDELDSEQIGIQSLIDDHRNLMKPNASFKNIQSQLRGEKPFFLKSSAGQELLVKKLDISSKKTSNRKKSSFDFNKEDKAIVNSSHTSIKRYNEPKAKGILSKAVPITDSQPIHNSQYFNTNQSKRKTSKSYPDALQSPQMLENNIMQNKAIAEPARQGVKKRQKISKFEELRQMIKPKNSEKNQNTQKQALKMQSKILRTSRAMSVKSEKLINSACLTPTKKLRKPENKLEKQVVIDPVLIKEQERVNPNLRAPLFSLYGGSLSNSSLNIQPNQIDNSPKATVTLQRLTQISKYSEESPRLRVPSIRFRKGVYDRAPFQSKLDLSEIRLSANSTLQRTLKALNNTGLFSKDSPQVPRSTSQKRNHLKSQVLTTPKAHTKISIAVEIAKQQLYSSKALKSPPTFISPKSMSTINKP